MPRDLVVASGFIDLHSHGHDKLSAPRHGWCHHGARARGRHRATSPPSMPPAAASRCINYGASAGVWKTRYGRDARWWHGPWHPASTRFGGARRHVRCPDRRNAREQIERGLAAGAARRGHGEPSTHRWRPRAKVLEAFRAAAKYHAPVFVHTRADCRSQAGQLAIESYLEVIGASAITGAPVRVVHLNSTSSGRHATHARVGPGSAGARVRRDNRGLSLCGRDDGARLAAAGSGS